MQRLVRLAAWLLIGAGGAALGRLAMPPTGLRGHYFTNLTRSGRRIAVTIDQSLSTDTLDNGTAGVWPSYSVEWSGFLVVDEAGPYEFSTLSDDGSELGADDDPPGGGMVLRRAARPGAWDLGLGTWGRTSGSPETRHDRRCDAWDLPRVHAAVGAGESAPVRLLGVAIGRGFGLFIRVFDVDRLEPPPDTRLPDIRKMLDYGVATHYSPATFVKDELSRHHYSAAQADDLMEQFALETAAHHPWTFAVNSLKQWAIQLGGSMQDEAICSSAQGAYLCSKRTQGYAREPFLNRPRYEHEPVRPWAVAYVRHFQIPMGIVAALALDGLIAYLGERRADWVKGLFLASVIAYLTFLPAFAQSPQDRYRLPIDGLLFTFAVFGVTRLVKPRRPVY